ncbi:MAG: hypothetical protein FE78DRAFT_68562 [Acidomyces sp. 'richmondensis']|nr:MAG: hypothetical protein FE78DRAFT_68562 [Acidomyces sp. 'richmondensis']
MIEACSCWLVLPGCGRCIAFTPAGGPAAPAFSILRPSDPRTRRPGRAGGRRAHSAAASRARQKGGEVARSRGRELWESGVGRRRGQERWNRRKERDGCQRGDSGVEVSAGSSERHDKSHSISLQVGGGSGDVDLVTVAVRARQGCEAWQGRGGGFCTVPAIGRGERWMCTRCSVSERARARARARAWESERE